MQSLVESSLIPILQTFDKARQLLQGFKSIQLPSIIVVGDQSAGKSSVLQSICQIQLPKGQNCVTRCPLIIQLRDSPQMKAESKISVWIQGEEKHLSSNNLQDSNDMINAKTRELAQADENQNEIFQKPIHIKITKPGSVDLTLIDLPGLNYTGNKAPFIRALIQRYIQNENAIILIVIPANADLTSSQVIEMANKFDKQSQRSILVVTKADLCQKNFNVNFRANVHKLKLGSFAVRNRTQSQLEQGITLEQQRKLEKELFKSHQQLRNLPESQIGTQNLITKIVELQRHNLIKCKPGVIKSVQEQIKEQEIRFKQMPPSCSNKNQLHQVFQSMLHGFILDMDNSIDAKYGKLGKEFFIRPALYAIFKQNFSKLLTIGQQIFSDQIKDKITDHIKTTAGRYLPNFIDPRILQIFVNQLLVKVRDCLIQVIDSVGQQIQKYMSNLMRKNFGRFNEVQNQIISQIQLKVSQCKKSIIKQLDFSIEIQKSGPSTMTSQYQRYLIDMKKQVEIRRKEEDQRIYKQKLEQLSMVSEFQKEKQYFSKNYRGVENKDNMDTYVKNYQVYELHLTLWAYWAAFIERFADSFYMKLNYMFLLRFSAEIKEHIQSEFNPNLEGEYSSFSASCLLDSSQVIAQRKELLQNIRKLQEAQKLLKKLH